MASRPLVIVRDEGTLYRLMYSEDIDRRATFVLDRRMGDRRRERGVGSVERRRADRRRHDVSDAVRRNGFAVARVTGLGVDLEDALA